MTEMRVCTNRGTGFAILATLTASVVLTTGANAGVCNPATDGGGDTFASPVDLTAALPIERCGNTCISTATVDDDCNGNSTGLAPDQWWSFTVGGAVPEGNFDFTLCGHSGSTTDYDAKMYVFDSLLNLVGCNDDGNCTGANNALASEIDCLALTAGTYFVVVDGFAASTDCGAYYLSIDACTNCDNTLPTPGGATQNEIENCATGLPTNDGCNANGETESAFAGTTILGTAIFDGTTRDTDWYSYVQNGANQAYSWTVDAEFPALIGLASTNTPGNPDCLDGTGFISPAALGSLADNCAQISITTACLPGQFNGGPATYRFFVAPQFIFVTDCTAGGRANYQATLGIVDPGCVIVLPEPNCAPGDFAETQNSDPTPIAGNVACVNGQPEGQYSSDNIFARVYSIPDDRDITCVEVGIETNSGTADQNIEARVLSLSPVTVPPALANTAVLASKTEPVPPGYGPARLSATFASPASVLTGDTVIVEYFWDATTPGVDAVGALFPGGNPLGQTGSTYILSNGCGIADYTDLAAIGFPDQAVVVDYVANAAGASCFSDVTGPAGPGNPDGNVDSLERLLIVAEWGSPAAGGGFTDVTGPLGPGNPDGNVDSLDFLLQVAEWGTPCNPAP